MLQWLYKITQFQVTEEGVYDRRTNFSHWFLQAVHDIIFNPKLTFLTDKAWSI
jgi:hypothetical protein